MEYYLPQLQNKIIFYYEKYYQSCGLADYKKRARARLQEEELDSERMKYLQELLNITFREGQKHFIMGTGTGGLAIILFKEYKCDIYGIESCEKQFEIIQEKCREVGINPSNFKQEFGENLSFEDNQFDMVHCFTVLEHVQNVEKCVREMIRITKPGGIIYINTPNYKFPREGHYKITFPTFMPKIFGYLYLVVRGRPYQFLKSINFITERQLNKILSKQQGIYWFRIYKPFEREKGRLRYLFFNFLKFNLFIYPNQEIIIRKKEIF